MLLWRAGDTHVPGFPHATVAHSLVSLHMYIIELGSVWQRCCHTIVAVILISTLLVPLLIPRWFLFLVPVDWDFRQELLPPLKKEQCFFEEAHVL